MKNFSRIAGYYKPDVWRILFALLLLVASIAANLLKPWPLAVIVDHILGGKPLPKSAAAWTAGYSGPQLLALMSGLIFALHAAHGLFTAWQSFSSIKIGLSGLARVRRDLFGWLQRLSLKFYNSTNQGDLIYRATWDTYSFQTLFQQGFFTFVSSLVSLVLMVAIMWRLNVRLTLAALATVPPLLLIISLFGKGMGRRSLAGNQADSKVSSLTHQSIANIQLIQSYTNEPEEQKRFAARVAEAWTKRASQHGYEVLYWLLIALVFGAGTAGIGWLGAQEVQANRMTVGTLLIFLAYLAQLYEPLNQLSRVGALVSDAGAGAQRVLEILDTKEEVKDSPAAKPLPPVRGEIEFSNVSFGYREGQTVLDRLSFTIKDGESAAIIGPSGVGKTTLLQLLPRFFDPRDGAVKLDGIDLRELRLRELRSQVALVLQESILLPASIAENIAYGKPGAKPAEIAAAARAANADAFIDRLPDKYATIVGEGAARLSVGEKQRINLARAFLKDAPILLLDEPTSALDAESEALVMQSINNLMKGRTTLLVAHRLSTIRQVNNILVLEQGRLAAMGPPSEMEKAGYYARLLKNQNPPAP